MIIFYNKKTGDIIGIVDGRLHTDGVMENLLITPQGVDKKDIGKYIVPLEIKERELIPTGYIADYIIDSENGKLNLNDYKVEIENEEIVNLTKK